MEAEEILNRVKTAQDVPGSWTVFPLLRKKVLLGIFGWAGGALMGLALLALIVPIVVPYNYQRGATPAIFTTLLLGVLLFVTVGSLWLLVVDANRVRHAEKHVIVITEEAFVKQEGEKVLYVPLVSVRHVTPRGRAPVDPRTDPARTAAGSSMPGGLFGFGMSRGDAANTPARRRGKRVPTSLAFIDARTNTEVKVVDDGSYGDPFAIADVLKEYANSASIKM